MYTIKHLLTYSTVSADGYSGSVCFHACVLSNGFASSYSRAWRRRHKKSRDTDLVDLQQIYEHSDLILRYAVDDLAIVANKLDEHLGDVESNISLSQTTRQLHDARPITRPTYKSSTRSSAVAEAPRLRLSLKREMGHSRSLKMVPFESFGMVSYSHSIATMAVSLAVLTQYTNVTETRPDIARASLGCIARQKRH